MEIEVGQEDMEAGQLTGATGEEVIERSIHSALDRYGVPRDGREVKVTRETIMIELPPGWEMDADQHPRRS